MSNQRYCVWCGSPLVPDAAYCVACGRNVDSSVESTPFGLDGKRFDFRRLWSIKGRIGRKDYWVLFAVSLGGYLLLSLILDPLASGNDPYIERNAALEIVWVALGLGGWLLATIVGWIAAIKRLHDLGLSGWLTAIMLIPILGWLIVQAMSLFLRGQSGRNAYGLPDSGTPFPGLHQPK